jgi:hypothetical protein
LCTPHPCVLFARLATAQLCTGLADTPLAEALQVRAPDSYTWCAMGGCVAVGDGVDDAADFRTLAEALAACGVSPAEQAATWQLLASLLALGQVKAVPLSTQGDNAATAPPPSSSSSTSPASGKGDAGPCSAYKIDMAAATDMTACKCGYPKASHADAGGRRRGTVMNAGAATGKEKTTARTYTHARFLKVFFRVPGHQALHSHAP